MNSIRRISLTLKAQFNDFVRQVENHEAIAEATLKDFRANIHTAKFRLRMLERAMETADQRASSLSADISRWRQRAIQLEGQDQPKALECVRRMKTATAERDQLLKQIAEMRATQSQVSRDVMNVEGQYQALKMKHQTLLSRQSSAEAIKGLRESATSLDVTGPEIFEQWEANIVRQEVEGELFTGTATDELEAELRKEEEAEELMAELATLKTQTE